jgi:hypothetical protein
MLRKIVRDAADGVDGVRVEIDSSVGIEVNGITPDAAGEKLRVTKCPRVGPLIAGWIAMLLAGEEEQVFEFALE